MPEKMTLEEVNRLERNEFVSRLGSVFESSPWVAERAWGSRPFGGFSELYGAMVEAVDEAPEEYEAFTEMNTSYRQRFGFPMIVCVRVHTNVSATSSETPKLMKEHILRNAKDRLKNSREEEIEVALGEIAKIARLRLEELVETDEAPRENQGGRG